MYPFEMVLGRATGAKICQIKRSESESESKDAALPALTTPCE